jgi:hypothetical protein
MGGYGSTRWNWAHSPREETGACLFLDMPYLRKLGGLEPGAVRELHWNRGGKPSGSILTIAGIDGRSIDLAYSVTRRGDTEPTSIRETVDLDFTPCHYGGERPWFRCPHCYKRRGVLYSVGGRFHCRQCHKLAYSSTREDDLTRSFARADALRKRLGARTGGGLYGERFPLKPKGMHWDTYDRLLNELRQETDLTEAIFYDDLRAMAARVDTLAGSMRTLDKLIR